MMMKKEFIRRVNEDLETTVKHINKNNKVGYDVFTKVDVTVSPTVNVDDIYNIYETEGYEVAVEKLREILDRKPPIQDLNDLYSKLSNDRLTIRLVNYEVNKDRLKKYGL